VIIKNVFVSSNNKFQEKEKQELERKYAESDKRLDKLLEGGTVRILCYRMKFVSC